MSAVLRDIVIRGRSQAMKLLHPFRRGAERNSLRIAKARERH